MTTSTNEFEKTKDAIYKNFNLEIIKTDIPIYIFGTKLMGRAIYDCLTEAGRKIQGFIDNKALPNTKVLGKNVFHPKEVLDKKDKILVIIASITYLYEITEQLKDQGFKHILPAYLLGFEKSLNFNKDRVCENLLEDYIEHKNDYENLRTILCDADSKKTLDAMIDFRKTFNTEVYHNIRRPWGKQYFEEFVPYKEEYPFIDAGAYTGDTSLEFVKFCGGNYKKIYFLEPDPKTLEQGKELTKHLKNIEYCNYAVCDCKKQLKFSADLKMGSKISDEGEMIVEGIDLDSLVKEDKCYIKMDIEGAEKEALLGAKRLIKNGSILAVSAYHKAEDIRILPKTILEINPNYDFYLRHYMDCIFETVLYAIPKI